jgi:hypothetical protein
MGHDDVYIKILFEIFNNVEIIFQIKETYAPASQNAK